MDAVLARALELHRNGELDAAERLYLGLVASAPEQLPPRHMLGVLRHQQGRNAEAAALIAGVLDAAPDWPDALVNHGSVLQAVGRHADAVAAYARALRLHPDLAEAHHGSGNALAALGRHTEALAAYDAALELRPQDAAARRDRGNTFFVLGRHAEAVADYEAALALAPASGEVLSNRGAALAAQGRWDEALASYEQALQLCPDCPEALYNRAATLLSLGRLDAALDDYEAALAVRPDWREARYERAKALTRAGRDAEAVAEFDRLLALAPDSHEALNERGRALLRLSRDGEALESFLHAIERRPEEPALLVNAGLALQSLGRLDEAAAHHRRALAIAPDHVDAHLGLATVLELQVDPDAATAHLERALALQPQSIATRCRLCTAQLPPLYRDCVEIETRRLAYRERLQQLDEAVADREAMLRKLYDALGAVSVSLGLTEAVGAALPFFLPYQQRNDRELQRRWGELICRVAAVEHPAPPLPQPPGPGERVRVGIVSGFLRAHSNWKVPIHGWASQLDRGRFRLFLYHTGGLRTAETEAAEALAERFVQGPLTAPRWRQEVLSDRPHVLIYPEIGMDAAAAGLAAQRLAPVQCASWGHPNTTGYPTIDYFLSSELMEPEDGQDHYTERLLRLPGLSIYYEPVAVQPVAVDRAELGLRPRATVFWCGQSLYKYLPQYDAIFPRIAAGAGDCQFVFHQFRFGREGTELMQARLARAFAEYGLDAQSHCVFLPGADANRFIAIIGQCDIVLDSIGWSGCNSTLESLEHALPIVTLPGALMRGRHSAAILGMIGVTETIAADLDHYIAIAIRLAREPSRRQRLRQRMSATRHRAYRDRAPIAALEDFLDRVARGQAPPPGL